MYDTIIAVADQDVRILGRQDALSEAVLSQEAISFIVSLERSFRNTRKALLQDRHDRQHRLDGGENPQFLDETRWIREDPSWRVGSIPDELQDRRVEITGPVERKMMINALNSGANVFMADCEDASSPTWLNVLQGQDNLREAVNRTLSFVSNEGKKYRLTSTPAVLFVRPRGWHLNECHVIVDGEPMSASIFDFGLYFFHNVSNLLSRGSAPYFYLPKLESHREAILWNDVLNLAQDMMSIPRGTIKVTVLIETILAAFEMEEILFALRDHIVALNAGRWDYIFSIIKKFSGRADLIFPDRSRLTMTTPFMRAYTDLLVQTCHKRGAHAIGGMAAFIPSRKDEAVNRHALEKVTEDKTREARDGFDGTWVAHPDLVPVARRAFDSALGSLPHQKHLLREDVRIGERDLLRFTLEGLCITEEGLRTNISVALQYLAAWLGGSGAVGIFNLMEDAATAEIARSQVWQWLHRPDAALEDGTPMTLDLYQKILWEEIARLESDYGDRYVHSAPFEIATHLFHQLVTRPEFTDFLTIEAYKFLTNRKEEHRAMAANA
jgi:malate synthase